MEEYFVYILYSRKLNQFYKGHSNNVDCRFFAHNSGLEKSTKSGVPWILVHTERFNSRSKAMRREKELKTGRGRDFLEQFRPGSPPRRTKD